MIKHCSSWIDHDDIGGCGSSESFCQRNILIKNIDRSVTERFLCCFHVGRFISGDRIDEYELNTP